MALMSLGAIVTAIVNKLNDDARTNGITWHDGYRSPAMIQKNPGGSVFVDSGEDIPTFMGNQVGTEVPLKIVVWALARNESVGVAEKEIQGWIDKVLETLRDNWNIRDNPLAAIDTISFRTSTHPESQPPEARFLMTLNVTVHLH